MIKQIIGFITIMALLWLCACSSNISEPNDRSLSDDTSAPLTWQEQYDLGIRYLSEGNYQEAIIAFTAAIEINPKEALAYVGRGDAYVGMGEATENFVAAQADYETAISLADDNIAAYTGLADVYLWLGQNEQAIEILMLGIEKTGSEELKAILDSIYVEDTDENGFNSHGARAFTLRDEYIPFDNLPSDGQTYLRRVLQAVVAEDRENLLSLAGPVAEFAMANGKGIHGSVYTMCDGYKLRLTSGNSGLNAKGSHLDNRWDIEIRPQNGTGYYVEVMDREMVDSSKVTDSFYYDFSKSVLIRTCPCIDWQWNGEVYSYEINEFLEYFNNAYESVHEGSIEWIATGQMKDSLREGAWTYLRQPNILKTDNRGYSDTEQFLLQNDADFSEGKCIAVQDELLFGFCSVDHYYTLREGSYGSMILEDFYW